jgi:alkylation response protein AidB-like acyl-CoA dehydrogenase
MQFEFTEDQLELRDTARALLAAECPPSVVRAAYEERGSGAVSDDLWRTLVELDWPALGLPEFVGGMGFGFVEVGILVEELGRATAPSPYLATITQYAAGLQEAGSTFSLTDVAHGRCTGTLAIAEAGVWRPEAIRTSATPAPGGGWALQGRKSHVIDGASATEVLVVARRPGTTDDLGLGLFVVPGASLRGEPLLSPMDVTIPTATVDIDTTVDGERVLVEPGDPRARSVIDRTLQQATTAITLSTVATCRAIFEMTLQYAKDREQFGRPIGSFQALKHRLADMYLAVERASALGYFAALTIAEDDDRRAVATSMAKAAAGECQRLVVKDGLQMHGGVGYTWEHDLHLLLKRAKAGALLFGTAATHRAHLARLLGLEAVA